MSLKNPVTPPGIDPGTVRLARRLNHYVTPGPINKAVKVKVKVKQSQYSPGVAQRVPGI